MDANKRFRKESISDKKLALEKEREKDDTRTLRYDEQRAKVYKKS